ncbi:MAG TPA: hypothetical protein VJQ85_05740 [Gaiellaceae bacterium]|nr:hypothetical protein [Gaiellaceae bacterium]
MERFNRSPGVLVGGTHTALRNSLSLDEVETEQNQQFDADDPERRHQAHP